MNRVEKIAALRQRARVLEQKADNLEQNEDDEVRRPILRQSLGRCFKYSNSYGDGKRWPLYIKIVAFDEKDLAFKTVQFQHTSRRIVNIEYERVFNFRGTSGGLLGNSNYEEITVSEYNRARNSAKNFVMELLEQ